MVARSPQQPCVWFQDGRPHVLYAGRKTGPGTRFITNRLQTHSTMKNLLWTAAILLTVACCKSDYQPEFPGVTLTQPPPETLNQTDGISPMTYSVHDWPDVNNDGLTDGWTKDYPGIAHVSLTTIPTGGSFVGRYQMIENPGQFALYSPPLNFPGGNHVLTLEYRSNVPVYVIIRYTTVCGYIVKTLPPVTDAPELVTIEFNSNVKQIMFFDSPSFPGLFQVDDLTLN